MIDTDYIVISPVRNEGQWLPLTVRSMAAQSCRPRLWVLVDDGSTDETAGILKVAAAQFEWIRPVRRADRGFRQAGGGVIEAFYDGFNSIKRQPWRFLVKLDGDVSFEPDYFERCFQNFQADSRLGIAGGLVCAAVNGGLEPESRVDPRFHVRGATKIYRSECWEQIGGLARAVGWDTLDEIKANMLGWRTQTFFDIKLTHHRPAGQAYGSWSNWAKNGLANYINGYHPLFMLVKCARRAFEKPYGIAALGLLKGFLSGYIKRIPQVEDRRVIRYLRQQQMNRLLGRKNLWDATP